MYKILLFGKHGQIGSELTRLLSSFELTALGKNDVDILDHKTITKAVNTVRPDFIINTVAYNDVDGAESNPNLAISINTCANKFLACLSAKYGSFYITYSSDYVFDGEKRTPYLETDIPNPLNKYGKSKLDGDIAVQNSTDHYIILRTSSVYSLDRPCFLTKIIAQAKTKNKIQVPSDLVSCPTSAKFIAQATAILIQNFRSNLRQHSGLYNLCASGAASRYEWAMAIKQTLNLDVEITPICRDFLAKAPRPTYSCLGNLSFQNTFSQKIPHWKEILDNLLNQFSCPSV